MRSAQLPDTFTTNLGWSLASLHASMSGLSFELRANGANALIARTSAASTVCTSPSFNNHCGYEYTRGIMELRSVKGKQKLNDVNDGERWNDCWLVAVIYKSAYRHFTCSRQWLILRYAFACALCRACVQCYWLVLA